MKYELIHNQEIRTLIQTMLEKNDGYCPTVPDSKGKPEYKCICQDFINNIEPGNLCHCMLYKKIEN